MLENCDNGDEDQRLNKRTWNNATEQSLYLMSHFNSQCYLLKTSGVFRGYRNRTFGQNSLINFVNFICLIFFVGLHVLWNTKSKSE